MREIKFRGKRTADGKWTYGWLVIEDNGTAWISKHSHAGEWEQVDPETVGQFTGMLSNDGVEAYEWDIVRIWGGEHYNGVWERDETIVVEFVEQCLMYMGCLENMEIIGNIHDNPDLGMSHSKQKEPWE